MKTFHAKAQSFTQRHKVGCQRSRRSSLRLCVNLCAFARNCFFVLLFCAFPALAQSPENNTVAQRALLRGYIETGRYTEAEAAAKHFLQKSPDAGPIRHELAETYAISGRYTDATREVQ